MKFGICCAIDADLADTAAKLGYDYLEFSACQVAGLEEDDFKARVKKVNDAGIKIETCNGLFPKEMAFVGTDVDWSKVKEYSKSVVDRMNRAGVETIVFGSGSSRAVPEDFSREEAYKQIEEAFSIVCEETARTGINIAIETLNITETNTLNSLKEGYDFIKKANLPNLHLLADLYHVAMEGDITRAMNDLRACKSEIIHTHISNPIGRKMPYINDGFDYNLFFGALKDIGYDARVSIEGGDWFVAYPTFESYERQLEEAMKLYKSLGLK